MAALEKATFAGNFRRAWRRRRLQRLLESRPSVNEASRREPAGLSSGGAPPDCALPDSSRRLEVRVECAGLGGRLSPFRRVDRVPLGRGGGRGQRVPIALAYTAITSCTASARNSGGRFRSWHEMRPFAAQPLKRSRVRQNRVHSTAYRRLPTRRGRTGVEDRDATFYGRAGKRRRFSLKRRYGTSSKPPEPDRQTSSQIPSRFWITTGIPPIVRQVRSYRSSSARCAAISFSRLSRTCRSWASRFL